MIQKSIDNIVLVFAFFLLLASSYFLYLRPYQRGSLEGQPTVAEISLAKNTVKYRGRDNFSWENAQKGLPLVTGDTLYTHELSGAKIDFVQGAKLSMEPFTLLKISQLNEDFALDLLSGNISAELNGKSDHITLLLGNRKFRVSGKNSQIKIRKNGDKAQISVLKGQIQIFEKSSVKNAKQEEFGVSELELSAENETPEIKDQFELEYSLLPPPYQKVFPDHVFSFEVKNLDSSEIKNLNIQIENKDTGEIKEVRVSKSRFELKNLGAGLFSLKTQSGELKSPSYSFTIENYDPPYFELPLKEITVDELNSPFTITYDTQEYPQKILLIKDSSLIMEKELEPSPLQLGFTHLKIQLPKLSAGSYQWKMISLRGKKGKKSEVELPQYQVTKPFTVIENIPLPAPKLSQIEKREIHYVSKEKQIQLNWEAKEDDSSYEVLVAGKRYLTESPPLTVTLPVTKEIKELKWKVREIKGKRISPFSSEGLIEVIPAANFKEIPSMGTKILLDKPNQLVDFEWDGNLKGKEVYEFELSSHPHFKKLVSKETTTSKNLQVPIGAQGEYYWRVRIKDKSGKIRYGEPVKILVQPAPPPAPLKLKEKIKLKIKRVKKTSLLLFFKKKSLLLSLIDKFFSNAHAKKKEETITTISWPSLSLAKAYRIRIYEKDNFNNPIVDETTKKASFTWKNPKAGEYHWQVAIIDYWDRVGLYSNRSLLVLTEEDLPKKKIPSLQLISPKHRSKFEEEKVESVTFIFSGAEKGVLEFSDSLNFKSPLLSIPFTSERATVGMDQLLPLGERELYWRITDDQRKSLTRKISFKKSTQQKPISYLAISKIDPWKYRLFQRVNSISTDQTGAGFQAKASGIFVNLIGIQTLLTQWDNTAWLIEAEAGKGVAFNTLDYFQGKLSLQRFSKNSKEWFETWSPIFGVEAIYQTSFNEASQVLTAEQNLLFGGLIGIHKPFTLFGPAEFIGQVIYGTTLIYRAQIRNHWGKIKNYPFSTLLSFEGLNYEDGAKEFSRTNLGIGWELSF